MVAPKVALITSTLCLCGAYTLAQTNERIYEQLDFRFVTPGARAVGMGKAFVGLADDATAAESNPAGLSNLFEPEVSFELSGTQYRHLRYTGGGRNPTAHVFESQVWVPAFVSYVQPIGDATLSFYRQALQKFRDEFRFEGREIPVAGRRLFEDGAYGKMDVGVVNYGAGLSYVFSQYLSLGGSFRITHVDLESRARSGFIEAQDLDKGTDTDDAATTWTGTVGILLKATPRVAVGATYHGPASVLLETTFDGRFAWYTGEYPDNFRNRTGETDEVEYVLPSRFAVGASWRLVDEFVLVFDMQRVNYSERVTEKFLIVDFQNPVDRLSRNNFYFDDVTELHGGLEYRWITRPTVIGLRLGFFTDPDHFLRFRPDGMNPDPELFADEFLTFRFDRVRPGRDYGFTGGFGFTLFDRFQADFALSRSDDVSEVVVSFVARLR